VTVSALADFPCTRDPASLVETALDRIRAVLCILALESEESVHEIDTDSANDDDTRATGAAPARSARIDLVHLSDAASRARSGDEGGFRILVELTTPVVYRLALRSLRDAADAQDAVQETFMRTWKAIPRLSDPRAALAFVCTIARAAIADRHRRRARHREHDTFSLDDDARRVLGALASDGHDPIDILAARESREILHRVIATLAEHHRVVLLLRDVDGLTSEETALAIGVPVGTVDSRLSRAREALALAIQKLAQQDTRRTRRWPW
jgi:RNA polymerase sigma-70 factor (ECF subfamily)